MQCHRKISKFLKINLVTQSEAKIRSCKNGRIESDDLKTGATSKHGLDVKMIGGVLDGCLDKNAL